MAYGQGKDKRIPSRTTTLPAFPFEHAEDSPCVSAVPLGRRSALCSTKGAQIVTAFDDHFYGII
jgi:hypothetical protein